MESVALVECGKGHLGPFARKKSAAWVAFASAGVPAFAAKADGAKVAAANSRGKMKTKRLVHVFEVSEASLLCGL